jgi:hypothetical protein
MLALKQKQLFDTIDVLPIELKTKIVEKILASINHTDTDTDDLWITEAHKRQDDIQTGKATLINGDEVFQKISHRLS